MNIISNPDIQNLSVLSNEQNEPEKVNLLMSQFAPGLPSKDIQESIRPIDINKPEDWEYVLQEHHADRDRTIKVILCANCHDTIRRTDLDELKKARKSE